MLRTIITIPIIVNISGPFSTQNSILYPTGPYQDGIDWRNTATNKNMIPNTIPPAPVALGPNVFAFILLISQLLLSLFYACARRRTR